MIQQAKFSKSVRFFEPGFLQRWDVKSYYDKTQSCFFAGVYDREDVDIINSHKGLAVVWNTGYERECFNSLRTDIIVCPGMGIAFHNPRYKIKKATFEIKDFSMFEPNPLGGYVYAYMGNERVKDYYGYETVKEIEKYFPVIYGYQGSSIEKVKKEYYDNCFVNIKMAVYGGLTSATELALMGRRTISNTDTPFCMPYTDVKSILTLIEKEAKKIGTIQPSQIGNYFNTDKEWLNENFWL